MIRISFVCQAGDLEPKAVLLAASLRAHFPADMELVAGHPAAAGSLKPEVETALRDLNVRIVPIANPLGPDDPTAYRFAGLALTAGPDLGLFLDTNILALRAPEAWPAKLSLAPAAEHHHDAATWERAHRLFGLAAPQAKTGPRYDTGVIAVPGRLAAWAAMAWIETRQRIGQDASIAAGLKPPHLSQLALPVAAARLGLDIAPLDAKWNFPGGAWPLQGREAPYFFHYPTWRSLRSDAACRAALQRAATLLPSVQRALASFPEPAA